MTVPSMSPLTSLQEKAVTFLHGKGEATPEAIGNALGLDKATTGHLLYELGASGLRLVTGAIRHNHMCLTLNGRRVAPVIARGGTVALPTGPSSPSKVTTAPNRADVSTKGKDRDDRDGDARARSLRGLHGGEESESGRPGERLAGPESHRLSEGAGHDDHGQGLQREPLPELRRAAGGPAEGLDVGRSEDRGPRPEPAKLTKTKSGASKPARVAVEQAGDGAIPLRAGTPKRANREAAPSSPATKIAPPLPVMAPHSVGTAAVEGGADAVVPILQGIPVGYWPLVEQAYAAAAAKASEGGPHEKPDSSGLRERAENLGPSEQSSGEPPSPVAATSAPSSRVDAAVNDDGRVVLKGDHAPVVEPDPVPPGMRRIVGPFGSCLIWDGPSDGYAEAVGAVVEALSGPTKGDQPDHEPEPLARIGAVPELLRLAAQKEATARVILDDAAALRRTISILANEGATPPVT